MSRGERSELARLARARAKHAKEMVKEREKVLLADVEEQLSTEEAADDEAWREIVKQASAEVDKVNEKIAKLCEAWGKPKDFVPEVSMYWSRRGDNATGKRRAELRKLAEARIAALGQSARVTIDGKLLEIETELVADGLDSTTAVKFLESLPTADSLLPRVDVAELDGRPERMPWEPPVGMASEMLTPVNSKTQEKRQAIVRALAANPEGSNREIGRMAGVDHKTVAKLRGEIPTETGEIPTE
jgi:hypothetical protein